MYPLVEYNFYYAKHEERTFRWKLIIIIQPTEFNT